LVVVSMDGSLVWRLRARGSPEGFGRGWKWLIAKYGRCRCWFSRTSFVCAGPMRGLVMEQSVQRGSEESAWFRFVLANLRNWAVGLRGCSEDGNAGVCFCKMAGCGLW